MSEKIYCGSGKEKFDGDLISVSVCLDDIPTEHRNEYNGKTYLRLNVQKKREVDQYGKSHSVSVDTWKPDNSTGGYGGQTGTGTSGSVTGVEDDIPF